MGGFIALLRESLGVWLSASLNRAPYTLARPTETHEGKFGWLRQCQLENNHSHQLAIATRAPTGRGIVCAKGAAN